MDQERTVNKLVFAVVEMEMDVRKALELSYAAGYDERGMDLNSHKTRKITKLNINGQKVKEYISIKQAAAMNKISRDTISDILSGKRRLTPDKQFYFKYSDEL